mgnify:CR=1 FL=1
MEIRLAEEKDIDGIIALQPQIYRVKESSPKAKESLKNQLEDETCDVLVSVDNKKIIATATIYYIQVAVRNQPYALFEGLVVDESQRGKGTGTAMLNKMVDVARSKNCYKIIFTSGQDRTEAHKFYENLGFKKWGLEFRMDL